MQKAAIWAEIFGQAAFYHKVFVCASMRNQRAKKLCEPMIASVIQLLTGAPA
jgi:hypothetical protein